jgi:Beta protein
MRDGVVYVPILKGKANDLKAFARLGPDARRLTKPLIEALPVDKSKVETEQHLQVFADRVRKLKPRSIMYLDFYGLMPDERLSDGTNAIVHGFALLRDVPHTITPVFGLHRNDRLWGHFRQISAHFGGGFCFRILRDDIAVDAAEDTWEEIIRRSAELGLDPSNVDLVLDLGHVGQLSPATLKEEVVDFVALNRRVGEYRSLVVAGSSALKEVSVVPKDGVGEVHRNEWHLWGQLLADVDESLSVQFGDYGVVHPDFLDSVQNPNIQAKIRYTVGDLHLYFRGHGLYRPAVDFDQYYELGKV